MRVERRGSHISLSTYLARMQVVEKSFCDYATSEETSGHLVTACSLFDVSKEKPPPN